MYQEKYIFAQLISVLNRSKFNRIVAIYNGDKYVKHFTSAHLRLVRYWDEEQKRELIFLTNAMHISALQVAELYKNRWQV